MKKELDKNKQYPLLPLRDIVVFPQVAVPLIVGRQNSVEAVDFAMRNNRMIVLVSQKDASVANPKQEDLYEVGILAEILQLLKLPNGNVRALIEGQKRVYIKEYIEEEKLSFVDVLELDHPFNESNELVALKRAVLRSFERYVELDKKIPKDTVNNIKSINDPSQLADLIASHLNLKVSYKQMILELEDPVARLEKVLELIDGEIEILELERSIQGQVRQKMEKTQKDYYLNEQLKIINKELGNSPDLVDESTELRQKIDESKMPKKVKDKALKELNRLEKMPPVSAESGVIRTYIEWLCDLPWKKCTRDNTDLQHARDVLDNEHYGLDDIKERIVDYLAVHALTKNQNAQIICFVGPPGVGKTSLGKSIANALGRRFERMSLGGVKDEAEIRGHRRTYVGAMPGKIVQKMKKTGVMNPVILLDEIDKIASDYRGDPAAALLEVLDPEQNSSFEDHYLETTYDLSQVLFLTTANVLSEIPRPLLDRMEVIELSSYMEEEKLNIAKKFLLPKQLELAGLSKEKLVIDDNVLLQVISSYTKEAGVRNLERTIAKICRKVARKVLVDENYQEKLTVELMREYLGPEKFDFSRTDEDDEIAVANGLAWTSVGGDVMPIEAVKFYGEGKLQLTGKLGDVMQESAQAAFTYVKANLSLFGVEFSNFKEFDYHLHVPEGAVPKDGPSAGITMAVVLASLACNVPVRHDVAMTGEITLRGKVLPIGGLKEKVIAAHRAGVKHIILPFKNEKDINDIPENIRTELIFHPVKRMEEVFSYALVEPEHLFKDLQFREEFSHLWKNSAYSNVDLADQ